MLTSVAFAESVPLDCFSLPTVVAPMRAVSHLFCTNTAIPPGDSSLTKNAQGITSRLLSSPRSSLALGFYLHASQPANPSTTIYFTAKPPPTLKSRAPIPITPAVQIVGRESAWRAL